MIRVVVVDDEQIARDGIARLLSAEPDVDVVGAAASGSEAVDMIEARNPDVVFLDVGMPAERGLYSEETARIIDEEVKSIVAAAHDAARRILRDRRDILERVTRTLLEKEVMEGDDLRTLMNLPRAVNL